MANETTAAKANETTAAKATKTDLVDLTLPRGYSSDEPNVIISVNGKNWVLPKGKTSKVPAFVKYEYDRACRAKEAWMFVQQIWQIGQQNRSATLLQLTDDGGASRLPFFNRRKCK